MRTAIGTAVLLVVSLTAGSATAQPTPQLLWSHDLNGDRNVVVIGWSPTGSCTGVATDSTIHVLNADGQELWTWDFRATSRFIRTNPFTSLAVAPDCQTVVIAGDSAYKYVWTANRQGNRAVFKTVGTPLAVRFALDGASVAVATGASLGYLLSPRLERRWSGRIDTLPVKWPSQAADSARATEFSRDDVDSLFGALLWGRGVSDSVSEDGRWRVVSFLERDIEPVGGAVEFWGPDAGGYRGRYRSAAVNRPRWVKPMGCPDAALTRDGMFVLVNGDPDHPRVVRPDDSEACDSGKLLTYVFDRDGRIVLTWPTEGDREALAAAVRERTGKPLDLRVANVWSADPTSADEAHLVPSELQRRAAYGPDRRFELVARGRVLRMYGAPVQ